MADNKRKKIGAAVGFFGAQVLVLLLYAFAATDCPCINQVCPPGECLWGLTLPKFWTTYGLAATAVFTILGYLISDEL